MDLKNQFDRTRQEHSLSPFPQRHASGPTSTATNSPRSVTGTGKRDAPDTRAPPRLFSRCSSRIATEPYTSLRLCQTCDILPPFFKVQQGEVTVWNTNLLVGSEPGFHKLLRLRGRAAARNEPWLIERKIPYCPPRAEKS